MPADRAPVPVWTPQQQTAWRQQENQRTGTYNGFKVDDQGNYRWAGPVQMDPNTAQRIKYANEFYDPKTGKYLGDPSKMPLAAKLILGGTLGVAGGFALAPLFAGGSAGAAGAAPAATGTSAGAGTGGIGMAGVPGLSYGSLGSGASLGGGTGSGLLGGGAVTAAGGGGTAAAGSGGMWGALKGIGLEAAKAIPSMVTGAFTGNAGKDLQKAQRDQLKFQLQQMMKYQPARDALFAGLMGRLPTHMKPFFPQWGGAQNMQAPFYGGAQNSNFMRANYGARNPSRPSAGLPRTGEARERNR